jgi:hypothetical protein
MRRIGANGVISNSAGEDTAVEALNAYAFARFARDKTATPAGVIDEFAGFVAKDADKARLARILRFVENHSTWQESMPEKLRLPNFDTGDLDSAARALEELSFVHPRTTPKMALPEPAACYLNRIRERLNDIVAKTVTLSSPPSHTQSEHPPGTPES